MHDSAELSAKTAKEQDGVESGFYLGSLHAFECVIVAMTICYCCWLSQTGSDWPLTAAAKAGPRSGGGSKFDRGRRFIN